MIIWLNGPFGVGKTSVARELVGLIPDARIVDPERIGYVMKRTFWRHHDYQDIALWRRLTVRQVHRAAGRATVIVPMTVVDPAVYAEITAGAHVFALTASREQITARIDAGDEAHAWRRQNLDRCMTALTATASASGSTPMISARRPSPRRSVRHLLHGERAVRFGEFEVGTTTTGVAFGEVASDPCAWRPVLIHPDRPQPADGVRIQSVETVALEVERRLHPPQLHAEVTQCVLDIERVEVHDQIFGELVVLDAHDQAARPGEIPELARVVERVRGRFRRRRS